MQSDLSFSSLADQLSLIESESKLIRKEFIVIQLIADLIILTESNFVAEIKT